MFPRTACLPACLPVPLHLGQHRTAILQLYAVHVHLLYQRIDKSLCVCVVSHFLFIAAAIFPIFLFK